MQRTVVAFPLKNRALFKQKLVQWAQQFETAIWLDSNDYQQQYSNFDAVLAVGEVSLLKTDFQNAFEKLQKYQSTTKDYIFGYISYDIKNDTEQLISSNFDGLDFPEMYFFQPKKLIFINQNTIEFHYLKLFANEIESDFKEIKKTNNLEIKQSVKNINIKSRIHKNEYLEKVTAILQHINRGNIYEVNFCQEFYAENENINPLEVYTELNRISEPPFAVFLKMNHLYLASASPERFIKKEGKKIISQPIKGTAKRLNNKKDDEKNALNLSTDSKERAENVMIVDLVRNDLSKSALKGSVKVEELCKVYSFKQVHQMISTIVCEIDEKTSPIQVIKDSFPMGSMTGAPKVAAMKIIENYEATKRGLYSGAVGYFTPSGNFDFNVVIRSILYNADKKYISYSVGSAITAKSIPEKEYEECLLKAKAMKQVVLNLD